MNKKKIIAAAMCCAVLISFSVGCGKKNNNSETENVTSPQTASEESIEYGGDINENGEITYDENAVSAHTADKNVSNESKKNNKLELEYDENGNISEQSAILLLQKYSTEQLGLDAGVEYQLLFDENKTNVNGKECYAIAAKKTGQNTEGVFYVALDASAVYKYDLNNTNYIKLP